MGRMTAQCLGELPGKVGQEIAGERFLEGRVARRKRAEWQKATRSAVVDTKGTAAAA